ncbi:eukaryotic translation initiation factor 4E-binding protein 3-like, partial [Panonychus citri]|uniref:eukaryotic translation initiation factor 4E-binding protein 3-like n=1 Tax=Panonychus citri TaxID=50023 RepID=UPI0023070D30
MFSRVTPEKQSTTGVSGLKIPTKKVQLTNLSQLPDDYCQTPGGTMFATTPGGTRIIYDRSFLLKMRNSPIASTPPKNLPYIAGVTTGISPESLKENKSPFKPSSLIKSEQSATIQKKIEQSKATSPTPSTVTTTKTTTTTTTLQL